MKQKKLIVAVSMLALLCLVSGYVFALYSHMISTTFTISVSENLSVVWVADELPAETYDWGDMMDEVKMMPEVYVKNVGNTPCNVTWDTVDLPAGVTFSCVDSTTGLEEWVLGDVKTLAINQQVKVRFWLTDVSCPVGSYAFGIRLDAVES